MEEVRIHCDISLGWKVAIRKLAALLRFPQVVRLTDKEKRGTKIRGNSKWFSVLDNDRGMGNHDHFCLQIAGNNFAIGEGEVLRTN